MFSSLFRPQAYLPAFQTWPEQLQFWFDLGLPFQTDVLRFRSQLADKTARFDLVVANPLHLLSSLRLTRLVPVEVPSADIYASMFEDPVMVLTRLKGLVGVKTPYVWLL